MPFSLLLKQFWKTVQKLFNEIRTHDFVVKLMIWQSNATRCSNRKFTRISSMSANWRKHFLRKYKKQNSKNLNHDPNVEMAWALKYCLLVDIFDFILRKMINQFNLLRMIRYVKNGQDLMSDGKGHEKKVQLLQLKCLRQWCCVDATL